ncbi:MAG: Gfo/Idh/MocA family protein [Planctomycetota bacterium]|jgi:predicted dehydrogenase
MDEPRICVVGAGNHATGSIYPYVGQAGGLLVGVCDLDIAKAEKNARLWGGTAYTDMEEMLDAETPDGVMICIGPDQHAELAPIVMRRGIPVYTEKPPAPSAAAALAVARVSTETGAPCSTGFKKRYANCYNRAKDWLAGFSVEDICSVSVSYCSAEYDNASPRTSYLLDFAIHLIDLVGYLFGEVDQLHAFGRDGHAYAVGVRFTSGTLGTFEFNDGRTWVVPAEDMQITVRGGNCMSIHNSSCWRITQDGQACEWREPPTFLSGNSGNETGHLAEIVDFFESIKEGRRTRSDIAESYKSMVLYEAILESAASGQVVKVVYDEV